MIREKLKESLPIIFSLFITIMLGVNVYDGVTITGNSFWYVIIFIVTSYILKNIKLNSKKENKKSYIKYNNVLTYTFLLFTLCFFTFHRNICFNSAFYFIILSLKAISYYTLILISFIIIFKLITIIKNGTYKIYFRNKRILIYSIISAIILSLFECVGSLMEHNLSFVELLTVNNMIDLSITIILLFVFLLITFNKLYNNNLSNCEFLFKNRKRFFVISFLSFFIIFIIGYLQYFPGIYTPDSIYQISQSLGDSPMTSHHPIFHTMLIKLFMRLTNSVRINIIIYCIFQMIALSFTLSFLLYYLIIKKVNSYIIVYSFVFLLFSPINIMYSYTLWKDIPFAISMIYLFICLIEMASNTETYFKKNINLAFLFCSILMVILFRNNGIYILILSVPIILIVYRKYFVKLLLVIGSCFTCYFLIKGFIFNRYDVTKGSVAEMLSIPVQQIARALHEHNDSITDDEKKIINNYLNVDIIGDVYDPRLSDPVKGTWKCSSFSTEYKDFFKVWYSIFKRYPITYINSFLSNNYGYWYPETSYWIVGVKTATYYDLYKENYGLENKTLIDFKFKADKIINDMHNVPVISMLFSTGIVFWFTFISTIVILIKQNYKLLVPMILVFALWLTLVASPVYAEFRYLYCIYVSLPLFLAIMVDTKKFNC